MGVRPMNDNIQKPTENTEPINLDSWISPGYKNVQLNYFLNLFAFLLGITAIVALVFAYINRDEGDDVLYSHYDYQIRTFWIGLLFSVISFILAFFIIGIFLFFLVSIWWLIRSIKGLILISRKQAITNPKTWLF